MKYIIPVLCSILLFGGCNKKSGEDDFYKALLRLDDSAYAHGEIDPEIRIEIEEIVQVFKDTLEQEVSGNEELGLFYKRLGQKYLELAQIYREIEKIIVQEEPDFTTTREDDVYNKMRAIRYYDNKMYKKAYESFRRAIEINPSNPLLFYHTGICAGWIAKSLVGPDSWSEQEKWYFTSEQAYKRALELDTYYVEALYGYAILLIIELDRAREGITVIKRIFEKEKMNIKALFLLARAYYQVGDYEQSLDQYDRILEITTSEDVKEQVRALKEQVKEIYYDSQ